MLRMIWEVTDNLKFRNFKNTPRINLSVSKKLDHGQRSAGNCYGKLKQRDRIKSLRNFPVLVSRISNLSKIYNKISFKRPLLNF